MRCAGDCPSQHLLSFKSLIILDLAAQAATVTGMARLCEHPLTQVVRHRVTRSTPRKLCGSPSRAACDPSDSLGRQ